MVALAQLRAVFHPVAVGGFQKGAELGEIVDIIALGDFHGLPRCAPGCSKGFVCSRSRSRCGKQGQGQRHNEQAGKNSLPQHV